MTDLEMTKACADAMELQTCIVENCVFLGKEGDPAVFYAPLRDDAQAMALVRRFRLRLLPSLETTAWMAWLSDDTHTVGPDVNSAIVVCIAKVQFDRTAQEAAATGTAT